jgi:hypothetical protein
MTSAIKVKRLNLRMTEPLISHYAGRRVSGFADDPGPSCEKSFTSTLLQLSGIVRGRVSFPLDELLRSLRILNPAAQGHFR